MINYDGFLFPKGKPRALVNIEKERAAVQVETACRKRVKERDGGRCFWPGCRVKASDAHHVHPRSLGGKWLTSNILSACRPHHDYFKSGFIVVDGNPDRGPVDVRLTSIGIEARIRLPKRKERAA